jgi:hypothetical protein
MKKYGIISVVVFAVHYLMTSYICAALVGGAVIDAATGGSSAGTMLEEAVTSAAYYGIQFPFGLIFEFKSDALMLAVNSLTLTAFIVAAVYIYDQRAGFFADIDELC